MISCTTADISISKPQMDISMKLLLALSASSLVHIKSVVYLALSLITKETSVVLIDIEITCSERQAGWK